MLTMKKKLIYWFTQVEIKITSISAPRQIDLETYAGNARVFPCIEFFATKGERQRQMDTRPMPYTFCYEKRKHKNITN